MTTTTDIPRVGQPITVAEPAKDDKRFHSVTKIIGVLDKSQPLIHWSVNETANKVVDRLSVIEARLTNEGRESAVEYVKKLRFQTGGKLSASDLGSVAHALFEEYALTGVRPQVTPDLHPKSHAGTLLGDDDLHDLRRMLLQFDKFLNDFQPEYRATEVVVYDDEYGYAGTCDAFMRLSGSDAIADYKTSRDTFTAKGDYKGPYPEVALQLAAYRFAQFAAVWRARRWEPYGGRYYLLNEAEREMAVPVPPVDIGVAIFVTPDYYAVHPVRCDAQVHESFLYLCETARWHYDESKGAVGEPFVPPHAKVVDDDPFKGLAEL